MHYKQLLRAHEAYYTYEPRAFNYDKYMKNKDWQSWINRVPSDEVRKLFDFIRSWDFHFQGDAGKSRQIYQEVYTMIQKLQQGRIEDVDFRDEEVKRNIHRVFDKVARCPIENRYESTDASKILHTIIPNLLVMWDSNIQLGILEGVALDGQNYAYKFLPLMQRELEEAIRTCIMENTLKREEAIREISESCDNKTLAKLIDEFNYVKYTLKKQI